MSTYTRLKDLLKQHTLNEITENIARQVRGRPDHIPRREILFRLYCIQGRWEKAAIQLDTLLLLDERNNKKNELYKNLIFSELLRDKVLKGEKNAATLDNTPCNWLIRLQQANQAYQQGEIALSDRLRAEAFDEAPVTAGLGESTGEFSWLADSDARLGPVCEFINAGGYRWIPYADIESLCVHTPEEILELIWARAQIVIKGETFYGFIPARYPINNETDEAARLGHKTEWKTVTELLAVGSGRKVLITDKQEYSLFELESVHFA